MARVSHIINILTYHETNNGPGHLPLHDVLQLPQSACCPATATPVAAQPRDSRQALVSMIVTQAHSTNKPSLSLLLTGNYRHWEHDQ